MVDALVSGASVERRASSSLVPGTGKGKKIFLKIKNRFFRINLQQIEKFLRNLHCKIRGDKNLR